jgi:hypothetical protein
MPGFSARSQDVQHLSLPYPGGLPGSPVLTGAAPGSNGLAITWDGPSGYYQLFETSGLKDARWQAVGKATNLLRRASVPTAGHNGFFRVAGPAPAYAGSGACVECHASIESLEIHTAHAGAFTDPLFAAQGGQTNSSCLACHTVGYGLPTGFSSQSATPQLGGVQCENCHGPAANHAANPDDPIARPRIELAATVCGGCHSGPMQPTFPEWQSSAHSGVVMDLNAAAVIDNCGRCHSGSARLALLQGNPLPVGDADMGIVCATCHDPHQTNSNPAQLRNPVASTNDYFITASGVFTNQYQANINICAQCHNHRGASWTDSSAPPHRSPQYNVLLGTVGELASGLPPNQPASHALLIPQQCVGCHMQTNTYVSPAQPANTGHSFKVTEYNLCLACHPEPQQLLQFVTGAISNQVLGVKAALDLWATTKAPPTLAAKYGALAWEYSAPGDLSAAGPSPSATEQALIPVNIQKARFNLYLVYHDGSFGVHNGPYSVLLLNTALEWVTQELDN